jgi:UDP-N-acetylglucosamine transferase subunit ALG13
VHESKNILISPLNWGLGHASRLMPIIDWCIENDKNVIIAGNGESLSLLKNKYPNLISETIPAPKMKYGRKRAINIAYISRSLLMIANIIRERSYTRNLIKKHKIDTIISDNRPGIWSRKLKTIYITHQLNVFTGKSQNLSGKILSFMHRRIIKKYTHCWIPDYENELSIAGRMSQNNHNLKLNYIGILSRFAETSKAITSNQEYKILCIASGPEPQRSILEKNFKELLIKSGHKSLIIRGLPNEPDADLETPLIKTINHCADNEFYRFITEADIIFCRSGYTTVMDLLALGRKAILVPTPGQPEQEYLAEYLAKNAGFISLDQSKLSEFDYSAFTDSNLSDKTFETSKYKKILALHL